MMQRDRLGLNLGALGEHSWTDYAIRFAFGGGVTVLAGLIAHWYGPVVGGLFLAFPAILPASVTLVTRHHGIDEAREETFGAALGSVGLLGFGATVWFLAERWSPWLLLPAAVLAWLAVSVALWWALMSARQGGASGAERAKDPAVAAGAMHDAHARVQPAAGSGSSDRGS
jgi:hypothetical protein